MAVYPQFRRVIDVMKQTKDTVTSQLTTAEKQNLVACLKTANTTHVSISIPLATNAEFIAVGRTPSPRTIEDEWLDWANVIHAQGLGVLFRPAIPAIEQQDVGNNGLYGMPLRVGANRMAAGTLASVLAGDYNSLVGKTYQWIVANPGCFNDTGPNPDIWAVAPERNESKGIYTLYQDSGSPVPHSAPGVQQNFVDLFKNFHLVAQAAFASIGKPNVITGDSALNYHDVRNGWMPQGFFDNAGRTTVDYYGNYNGGGFSAEKYVTDMEAIYNLHGKRIAWQEYGPIETFGQPMATRAAILRTLLDLIYSRLVITGKLEEFNLWGGWSGQNTSILNKTGSGAGSVYTLNELGLEVKRFYDKITTVTPVPTISSFTATPSSFSTGQAVTLAWNVSDAESLSIDQGVGTVTGNSKQVNPTATTTYTLTAANTSGITTRTVTITLVAAPPPVTGRFLYSQRPVFGGLYTYAGVTEIPDPDPPPGPLPTTRLLYSQRPVFGGVWTYAGTQVFVNRWTKRSRSTDNSWTKGSRKNNSSLLS